jgi:hypothetical protein
MVIGWPDLSAGLVDATAYKAFVGRVLSSIDGLARKEVCALS